MSHCRRAVPWQQLNCTCDKLHWVVLLEKGSIIQTLITLIKHRRGMNIEEGKKVKALTEIWRIFVWQDMN